MNLLAYLEQSALSDWLSVSMLGFPMLIALHSVGMAIVVGLSLMVALRLNGMLPDISHELLPKLVTVAIWGFGLNFVTGVAIFITRGSEYITSLIFLVKMGLVVVSAGILIWLGHALRLSAPESFSVTEERVVKRMSVLAAALWFAAVVAGRLIAYLSSLYR